MKYLNKLLFFIFSISFILQAQTVYTTHTNSKYHKVDCKFLKIRIETTVNKAMTDGFTPCSRCYPPILKSKEIKKNAVAKTVDRNKKSESNIISSETQSNRCQATSKKGAPCKRKAKPGSKYCLQHAS